MTQPLTMDEYGALFASFDRSAFRLETQREYDVDEERGQFAAFLAGAAEDPTEMLGDWLTYIRDTTAAGRSIERVRIYDTPLTGYQRWEMWVSRWNIDAGETIHLLGRERAAEAGIPADTDWWLFDDVRVAAMNFVDGRLRGVDLITDPQLVGQFCAWRDLAVQHSASDTGPPA